MTTNLLADGRPIDTDITTGPALRAVLVAVFAFLAGYVVSEAYDPAPYEAASPASAAAAPEIVEDWHGNVRRSHGLY